MKMFKEKAKTLKEEKKLLITEIQNPSIQTLMTAKLEMITSENECTGIPLGSLFQLSTLHKYNRRDKHDLFS